MELLGISAPSRSKPRNEKLSNWNGCDRASPPRAQRTKQRFTHNSMRVLIHEHFCSGGLAGQPADANLLAAGAGMLRGVVEDFHTAGEDVTVLLDNRLSFTLPGRVVAVDGASRRHAVEAFDSALSGVDAALVIAPEHGDLLPALLERIERAGVVNLGSASNAVRMVSDKSLLMERLAAAGITVPASARGLDAAAGMLERFGEIVVKPNRGAGCVDTRLCRSSTDVASLPCRNDWLVQERVRGIAASLAVILPRSGPPVPLRAGLQQIDIVDDACSGSLTYSGGLLPLDEHMERRAVGLGLATLRHLPALHGFVGLDLILGERPAQDTLIEVNARPTVAYAGLRRLARFNIARLILGLPTEIGWRAGTVRYQANGDCETTA
jgi:predicted ATP-grasp superfamily ATP-dependent carboligase